MPPKKRTGVTTATKPEELTKPPATTIPEPKKEEVKVEVKPAESIAKLSVVQSAEKQSTWAVSKEETKSNKVVNTNVSQLSEEELLRLRKLRFSVVGTDVLPDDAEKLKTERLKKFGGTSMLDEKEELYKRKLKFGTVPGVAGITEDPYTVKLRLDKFGGAAKEESKDIIEYRRKKFGSTYSVVDLDDMIKKTKTKQISKLNKFKRGSKKVNAQRGHVHRGGHKFPRRGK